MPVVSSCIEHKQGESCRVISCDTRGRGGANLAANADCGFLELARAAAVPANVAGLDHHRRFVMAGLHAGG